jgi:hypothetical protein
MARGALGPFVEMLDRRLEQLAGRLERHADQLAADQSRRLDAIDEKVRVNARVVDEHLLAIGRAARSLNDAAAVGARAMLTTVDGELVLVSAGTDLVPPDGYTAHVIGAFSVHDGSWCAVDPSDTTAQVRVALLASAS